MGTWELSEVRRFLARRKWASSPSEVSAHWRPGTRVGLRSSAVPLHSATLRYFVSAPELGDTTQRLAPCPLIGASLRVHEPSYLLSLSLPESGRLLQLKVATKEQLSRWASAFARGGAKVVTNWQPSALPVGIVRRFAAGTGAAAAGVTGTGGGGTASAATAGRRWQIVVPGAVSYTHLTLPTICSV